MEASLRKSADRADGDAYVKRKYRDEHLSHVVQANVLRAMADAYREAAKHATECSYGVLPDVNG